MKWNQPKKTKPPTPIAPIKIPSKESQARNIPDTPKIRVVNAPINTIPVKETPWESTPDTTKVTPDIILPWTIRSVSSMKETKDKVCNPDTPEFIETWITHAIDLGVNYISVETPYDNPECNSSVAYTKSWVDAIHSHGLHVWHRHVPLAFEGIYNTPKNRTWDYLGLIRDYIKNNPTFFTPGDIFTPIPEPQNGGILGVTYCPESICVFSDPETFNAWLRNSMSISAIAFQENGMGGTIKIGYFGFDGFIAWGDNNPDWHGILEDETISAMGNITIDHYPEIVGDTMANDLDELQARYPNTPIIIGEWGTISDRDAIDDIKRSMQSAKRKNVIGFNYWHMGLGGNESLLNDDLSKKLTFDVVQSFFAN